MILFSLTMPTLGAVAGPGLTGRVMERFEAAAGPLIIAAVQNKLGFDSLLALSEPYRTNKQRSRKFKRYPARDADQPGILSGDLLEAIEVNMDGDSLLVSIADRRAISDGGFDYGSHFEDRTHFMEAGLGEVEDQLADVLLQIIFEELAL